MLPPPEPGSPLDEPLPASPDGLFSTGSALSMSSCVQWSAALPLSVAWPEGPPDGAADFCCRELFDDVFFGTAFGRGALRVLGAVCPGAEGTVAEGRVAPTAVFWIGFAPCIRSFDQ